MPPFKGLVLTPAPSETLKFQPPTATQSSDGAAQSASAGAGDGVAAAARPHAAQGTIRIERSVEERCMARPLAAIIADWRVYSRLWLVAKCNYL